MEDIDFHVHDFSWILSSLNRHPPIADAYEKARLNGKPSFWHSQQDHMCSWFDAQATLGSGAYSRKTPNYSARTTYNRLQSDLGYVWMAEALGVDPELVQKAADHVLPLRAKQRPGILRNDYFPWSLIAAHAKKLWI